tara:strand:+ start:637 stop:1104 length:468 start_codon:yes stop_codon:yes gene_type:complete
MKIYEGSCACGQVNYSIIGKPYFTQACHCKDCKKSTGSSYVIHSMIHEDDLSIDGEVNSANLPTGSGAGQRAYFCTKCGVYIYCKYKIAEPEKRIALRTKTLNDHNRFPPEAHIFVKDKDPWIKLDGIKNCFDTMYDRDAVWPEDSIKRLRERSN